MTSRVASVVVSFLILAAASSSWAESQPMGRAIPADVSITVERAAGVCRVATRSGAERSMPCDSVVRYVLDTLKLPAGASFGMVTLLETNDAEANAVMTGMRVAGYRLTSLAYPGPRKPK